MTQVVILTGGNMGDVHSRLERAKELLGERVGAVLKRSGFHQSAPWGFKASESFWNQVLELTTELDAEQVLDALQEIEQVLGRDLVAEARERAASGQRYASRMIDIDLLLYGDHHICTPRLEVPHPRLSERMFVLRPLCEILPDLHHPTMGRSMSELLEELKRRDEK